jgi:hypothetical protein
MEEERLVDGLASSQSVYAVVTGGESMQRAPSRVGDKAVMSQNCQGDRTMHKELVKVVIGNVQDERNAQ